MELTIRVSRLNRRLGRDLRWLLTALLVGGLALGVGPAGLVWAAPANDNFAAFAVDIASLFSATYTDPAFIDTTSATREAAEDESLSSCGSFPPAPANTRSVWYHFRASASGWVTLDTQLADYDTVLEVWTGPVTATATIANLDLPSVACNDDAGKGSARSEVTFQVTSGTYYYVMVRDYGNAGTGGNLKLRGLFNANNIIYVDRTNGDDFENTGSQLLPFRTIQKGVNTVAAGGLIRVVSSGNHAENVTINKSLSLTSTVGSTATSFTLTNGATLGAGTGGVTAPTVNVNQVGAPGARIQDGILLASSGGVVNVGAGTYAQNVTVNKSLNLLGVSGAVTGTIIQPASGAAVTLTTGAVTLAGFTIQNSSTGIRVTGGSGHVITATNFLGNAVAVTNTTAVTVTATHNYWGHFTGPTHPSNPTGTGNPVGDRVNFRPWCTDLAPTCAPLAGQAIQLAFTASPGDTQAGAAFASQPVVEARDSNGNLDTTYTGVVSLTISTNPGGGVLAGTTTLNAVNGVATFSGLSIDKVGVGYILKANSGSLTPDFTDPFTITAAPATKLRFVVSPSDSRVNAVFPTQPVVQAVDNFDNVDVTFTGVVTVAIASGTGTPGATLNGAVGVAAVNGVITYTDLAIDRVGANYQLTATTGVLTSPAPSGAFDITADQLAFTTSPGNSPAGATFPTQPVVKAVDAFGNVDTTFTGVVTIAISVNPGGGVLAGTTSVAAVNGVAAFANLSIDKVGVGYELTATTTALSDAASAAFNITANQLRFTTSPSDSTAGVPFPTQPVVQATDSFGNVDTTFNGVVTATIVTNPGGTLSGTAGVTAVNGVITYTNLSIEKAGVGYQLGAAFAGLTSGTSNSFTITAAAATKWVFVTSPGNTKSQATLSPAPVVQAQDPFDNLNPTFSGPVTVTLSGGTAGAALSGVRTATATGGVATFTSLSVDFVGVGYQLTAADGVLANGTSAAFNITADRLIFTTSPSNSTAGATFPTQPVVEARDNFGHTDTTFSGSVSVAIAANPGGGTLAGTTPVSAVGGVITYTNLSINKVGVGYTLSASGGGLIAGTSGVFNITPAAASQLVFVASPSNSTAGVAFPTQPVVEARDPFGNLDTNFTGVVTVTIKSGTGAAGATLSGTRVVAAVGGVVTYSGLSIDKAGSGYQLTASRGGLTPGDSNTFNITAAAATQLVFTTSPSNSQVLVAFPTQPVVEARDNFGNLDLTFSGVVSLTIQTGTGTAGATLGGTTSLNAVNGVAGYSGLNINRAGAGYRLVAASGSLAAALSAAFDIAKGNQTISFSALPPKTYGDSPFLVTATASSGLPISYTTAPPSICTNSGNLITIIGAGDCSVTASQPGNADYNPATPVSQTVVIFKANQTINFGALPNATYLDPPFAVTATATSGLAVTFGVTGNCSISGNMVTITGAGSCAVTASQLGNANYNAAQAVSRTFSIAKASQTIVFGLLATKVYTDAPFTVSATVASGLPVTFTVSTPTTCSVSGNTVTILNAGTCTVVAHQSGDLNYNAAADAPQSFTIDKATDVITFDLLPDVPYGTPPFPVTATTLSGVTPQYFASGSCSIPLSSNVVTVTTVGSCTITVIQPTSTANFNPAPGLVSQSFTVVRASQTISFSTIPDHLVSDPPFTITATASSGLPVTFSASGGCSVSGNVVTLKAVGACTITASQAGNALYLPAPSVSRTFNISTFSRLYLPLAVRNAGPPDLVVTRFAVDPSQLAAGWPATVTVFVANQGTSAAGPFWVDFYINPSPPPTGPNVPWYAVCGIQPCYGIAWYVTSGLGAGQSLTLTSTGEGPCPVAGDSGGTPGGYCKKNTDWLGHFISGANDLYVFADSWNCDPAGAVCVPTGAVLENNEANNRAELHGLDVTGPDPLGALAWPLPRSWPARSVKPSE